MTEKSRPAASQAMLDISLAKIANKMRGTLLGRTAVYMDPTRKREIVGIVVGTEVIREHVHLLVEHERPGYQLNRVESLRLADCMLKSPIARAVASGTQCGNCSDPVEAHVNMGRCTKCACPEFCEGVK